MFPNRYRTPNMLPIVALCLSTTAIGQVMNQVEHTSARELASQLQVGDAVFIRVSALPFQKVASATQSWTNHVGVVIDISGREPIIGESTFPLSKTTPLSHFLERSEGGRIEVSRLNTPLTPQQKIAVMRAAQKRLGIFYDTGFDLHSKQQFCSRYVREVLDEATGTQVGQVETFSTLLARNPKTDLTFWRVWYLGNIPWQRETVTPASLLQSSKLHRVFDGYASVDAAAQGNRRVSWKA
ncbi:YebB family permuted papain-like enzyme [Paludibacterium purpuratum]|uniref:Permuted papain-like amidase YaeF/Yiix C92 family enzyme n=1 Tax=Paludibacterium purpuratum TaxID=1144873 RepID=A0A4R7BCA9_9NEIS|nr:YebB family permuted papain-like enzyme [Paludibacterium purpuratum]TDR81545.1 permuted papain-like amidase YaeF/Yiix C92 family enzyme [Paludibacterium purpuratum]